MAEATIEKKPWWVSEEEKVGLQSTPQDNLGEHVASGVPDLKWVEKGEIIGEWTKKDGLIVYHFYKRDRRAIYDKAHTDMDAAKDNPQLQNKIAVEANQELAKYPWWPGFEHILDQVFAEHFKYHPHKTTYYSEVDSWSVMLPIPNTPVPMSNEQLELPFTKVALRIRG